MKKILFTLLIVSLILCGCGKKEEPVPKNRPTEEANPQTEEEPVKEKEEEKQTKESRAQKQPEIILTGKYTTKILNKNANRIFNIKKCAAAVDGYRIKNGSEFSFNRATGKRDEAAGYKSAPVIVKGEEEDVCDFGGGVCQISTTLYNAAVNAGLKITERHKHSRTVDYAPDGNDATVDYDTMDFKFLNNSGKTLTLNIIADNDYITAEVYEIN